MGWLNRTAAAVWGAGRMVAGAVNNGGWMQRGPTDDYWYEGRDGTSGSGMHVSPATAMMVTAVYGCIKVLAETVASLPCVTYRRAPNARDRERAPNHPLFELLHDQPNERDTAYDFWEVQMGHALLRGKAYAEKEPGRRGPVDQLWPLNPDRMEAQWINDGRQVVWRYQPFDTGVPARILLQDEVFRWQTLGGLSPIAQHREAIGLSLATQGFASRFFGNSAQPRGVIQMEKKLGDGRDAFLKAWDATYGGVQNSNKVAVLEEGATWQQIGVTNEDAQFLESRKFQVAEIARIFRVPPHMVGDLEKATFSNIEELGIEFVVYSLMPWLVRIEQSVRRDLILRPDQFFTKFTVAGLMRGNNESRAKFYQSAILNGWMTRNEVRELEDRNALAGLDEPLQPLNMVPAGEDALPSNDRRRPAPNGRAVELAQELAFASAVRAVHREATAVERAFRRHADANDLAAFAEWAGKFYGQEHPDHLASNLALEDGLAKQFCESRAHAVLAAAEEGEAAMVAALGRWRRAGPHLIAAMSLQDLDEEKGGGDAA